MEDDEDMVVCVLCGEQFNCPDGVEICDKCMEDDDYE